MSSKPSIASVNGKLLAYKVETTKSIQHLEDRLNKFEERLGQHDKRLEAIEDKLVKMEIEANDLKRQGHKTCVILSGPDLPKKGTDPNPVAVFCNAVKRKYDVSVSNDDLATVHWRARGDIIAKFLHTGPGSSFERLTYRKGKGNRNPHPEIKMFANVSLAPFDDKMRFYASVAKKCNTIKFYDILRSGKVGIFVEQEDEVDKLIPIENFEDIKPYLTTDVIKEIKAKNKDRKRRTKKDNPAPISQAEEDRLLEGMDES